MAASSRRRTSTTRLPRRGEVGKVFHMPETSGRLERPSGGSRRWGFAQEARRSGEVTLLAGAKKSPDLLSACLIPVLAVACLAAAGCSDPDKERLKQTTKAT